jgi:hypothetical protein
MRAAVSTLPALLLLAGCAIQAQAPACPAGFTPSVTADAFFGRNIGPRLAVSEADWNRFAARELTPRFPEGFSVADIAGQYRGASGAVVRERSKRVTLVLNDPAAQRARLGEAALAYKVEFGQESVLVTEAVSCARF